MNFIVDENLPRQVADWLSAQGYDAVHVSGLGLLGRPDDAIWTEACTRSSIIITRDADFLVKVGDARVLRLRIGNCSTAVLIARLEALWTDALARLAVGERIIEIG